MPYTLRQEALHGQTPDHTLKPGAPVLIPVTQDVITLAENAPLPTTEQMPISNMKADRLGPGDILSISVVENGPGGLFSSPPQADTAPTAAQAPAGARLATLPDLTIGQDGTIAFPYLGRVHTSGLTVAELSTQLAHRLATQTVEPQVIVALHNQIATLVTLGGNVQHAGAYPVPPQGEHILEAIARAGGTSIDPADARVRLIRNGQSYTDTIQTLLDTPPRNVMVRAGDYIDVVKRPRMALILGAVGTSQALAMPLYRLSLSEALAQSSGLDDSRADPRGLYVMRTLPAALARRMVATARTELQNTGTHSNDFPPLIPTTLPDSTPIHTILQFNFNSATGMFLAQNLTIHENDMIYVGNARAAQWQKFMNLIRTTSSPVTSTARGAAM